MFMITGEETGRGMGQGAESRQVWAPGRGRGGNTAGAAGPAIILLEESTTTDRVMGLDWCSALRSNETGGAFLKKHPRVSTPPTLPGDQRAGAGGRGRPRSLIVPLLFPGGRSPAGPGGPSPALRALQPCRRQDPPVRLQLQCTDRAKVPSYLSLKSCATSSHTLKSPPGLLDLQERQN